MKTFLQILFVFSFISVASQVKLELTPEGFAPIEIPKPDKTHEKLIEASKAWAPFYNKEQNDVYDVTENSFTIDAMKDNAFFYRNLGEVFKHRIKYSLKVTFLENTIRITFIVKEIYTNKTLTKTTVGDFFAPDGRLKEDFEEVRPSLEETANKVIRSYSAFIQN